MKERYVVDTNVLIAASVADPTHPAGIDATPDDPAVQMEVWQWLDNFSRSNSHLVLDAQQGIFEEYSAKLGFNDFGIQVVMHKWSTVAVDQVDVAYDALGHGILSEPLNSVVHDNADKKMVAASLAAIERYGDSCIAFAGDTDWHEWEGRLSETGLELEPVIEHWSRAKFKAKQSR